MAPHPVVQAMIDLSAGAIGNFLSFKGLSLKSENVSYMHNVWWLEFKRQPYITSDLVFTYSYQFGLQGLLDK